MSRLSILIPTIPSREKLFESLIMELNRQSIGKDVEILFHPDEVKLIGEKRNELLHLASGDYLSFIDDDDEIPTYYINDILKALEKDPDCCSLIGEITFDGKNPKRFIHSIEYDSYFEKDNIYYRPPNHLNTIKSDIAKQFTFPGKNFGEDTDWAMQICRSGLIKTESKIDKVLYYYKYISKK